MLRFWRHGEVGYVAVDADMDFEARGKLMVNHASWDAARLIASWQGPPLGCTCRALVYALHHHIPLHRSFAATCPARSCCDSDHGSELRKLFLAEHEYSTNHQIVRRHSLPSHSPQPKARRPKHPDTLARDRRHCSHFRTNIEELLNQS